MTDRGRILMCRPTQFAVQYVINPWMEGHVGRVRHAVAMQQWQALHAVGEPAGRGGSPGRRAGLPDMCFAANAGLVVGNRFIASTFRVYQRQPETPIYSQWFKRAGFDVVESLGGCTVRRRRRRAAADGRRVRCAAVGRLRRAEFAGIASGDVRDHAGGGRVAAVGGRAVLSSRHLFRAAGRWPGDVLPAGVRRDVAARDPQPRAADRRLEVQEADALRFACNALVLDRTIVMNYASAPLRTETGGVGLRSDRQSGR